MISETSFDTVLTLLTTVSEEIGHWVISLFEKIIGNDLPSSLESSVGILMLLTIFLGIAEFSRKILWIVVAVGWALVILRIAVELLG